MRKYLLPLIFFAGIIPVLLLFSSCHDRNEEVITKRIQYDVNIKSIHPDYDWWIQNLVGPQREKLVKTILQGAVSGKYKAYDYFYNPLDKKAVSSILTDTLILKVREPEPPYALKDSIVVTHIRTGDIRRLRFLEEWRVDPETMQFTKMIKGIAPVARRIDAEGKIRWQPLFWIFPNAKTARNLRQSL